MTSASKLGRGAVACGALLLLASPIEAKPLTLPELLDIARRQSPGLRASAASVSVSEAQLKEAERSRLPTGDLSAMIAPSPEIRCRTEIPNPDPARISDKSWREDNCDRTNVAEVALNFRGVFTRTELNLVQPIYTFGKIASGIDAAEAGLALARERGQGVRADLDATVRKAYFGIKLAREILATIDEGLGYIDDAQQKIEKELADGTGSASVADKLRLRTVRAEAEARRLEARRLGDLALSGLRLLLGAGAPPALEVDDAPLDATPPPDKPLPWWEDEAMAARPEVRMLDLALVAKRALAELEWRKQMPDLVLVGTARFARASSVDNPQYAFANDPFNTNTAGLAAALRMPLDFGPRNARAQKVAAEAAEIEARRDEALLGVKLEVRKAHGELVEALERAKTVQKGEKAGKAWIASVAQNLALGLAEAKDFSDALAAFFQMRVRYLQALYDAQMAASQLRRATGVDDARLDQR